MNTRSQRVDTDKRKEMKYLAEGVRHLRKSKQQAIAEYDKYISEKKDKLEKVAKEVVEECMDKIVDVTYSIGEKKNETEKCVGRIECGRFDNIIVYNYNPEYAKEKGSQEINLVKSIPYENIINIEII